MQVAGYSTTAVFAQKKSSIKEERRQTNHNHIHSLLTLNPNMLGSTLCGLLGILFSLWHIEFPSFLFFFADCGSFHLANALILRACQCSAHPQKASIIFNCSSLSWQRVPHAIDRLQPLRKS